MRTIDTLRKLDANYEVLYPRGGAHTIHAPATRGILSDVMRPASLVYGGASGIARWLRASRMRPVGSGAIVVSVGNLEIGGSGKTPFAAHLVGELARRGHRPAYVSRGYRSQAEDFGAVTVFAPLEAEPKGWVASGVRILRGAIDGLSEIVGDEGAMVAGRCPGVPLAFSRHRGRAIEVISELFRPTHVVLDDSFQTWSVGRDVDIVLLDSVHPLGNGRILPAGSLREGPGALRRAGVIGFNGIEGEGDVEEHARWILETVGKPVPVFGIRRRLSFRADGSDGAVAPRGRVAALSSVGRPRRFEESLTTHGVEIGIALRFPDHFRYGAKDIGLIDRVVASRGIDAVVTTEKDWVKFRAAGLPRASLWVARLELELVGADPVQICEKPQALPAASA
jgi:tetraacyldisaccharide 4'-kinase